MRAVFLPLLVVNVLAGNQVVVNNGAICENKATGFFVMDNTVLTSTDSIVYKDYSEDDCLKTCSQNRDQLGRSILCSSFVYHHETFTCTIYKDKKDPEGQAKSEEAVGKRYFEKICLNDAVPIHCADSQFLRVDNYELVGYAVELSVVETLEECLSICSTNSTCKSALYFYEENECILNTESALSKPDDFKKTQGEDKVIYFQNACAAPRVQIDPTTASPAKTEEPHEEESANETSGEKTHLESHSSAETPEPKEPTTEEPTNEEEEHEPEHEVDRDTDTDEPLEKVDNDHDAASPSDDAEYEQDKEELEREEEELRKEREQIEKLAQKASYLKYKQHPRNFASRTLKASDDEEVEPAENEHAASHSEDEQDEIEQLSKEEGNEPTEAQTKPLKKKMIKEKKEKKVESAEVLEEQAFTNYFSDWSDWTPCTKSGERQIRRRKCLDLRKCLGALMQVRNCPAVLPTTTTEGPIESIRSLVSVPGVEYDDTEIRAPVPVVRPRPNSPLLPAGEVNNPTAPEAVWGPWAGTCQQFASGQPCNDGQMIGFESRECVAKDPSYCEGPFFRYCTLAC